MGIGKAFVRSVVNQVGRDTGKVISNTLYGDSHSTPIRRVENSYYVNNNTEISYDEALKLLDQEGFKKNYKQANIIIPFILYFLSIFVFLISPIIYLIKGIKKITKKETIYEKTKVVSTYIADRRYKTGQRQTGFTNAKIEFKMPATVSDKRKYKIRGIIYLIMGISLFAFHIYILFIHEKIN